MAKAPRRPWWDNGLGNEIQDRQHQQNQRTHQDQFGGVCLPEGGAVRRCEQINQVADEGEEVNLDQGNHR